MLEAEFAPLDIEPWPRQDDLIQTDATEVMFGGASEGGKSHAIRMAAILWCTMIPGLQVLILRKFYADVVGNHMQGENNFHDMLRPWVEKKLVRVTENEVKFLFNGSFIKLGQCRTEEDFQKAQGIGKHVLFWDEATQIKPRHINDIRGWVRMTKEMKAKLPAELRDCFPRIVYTCNPIGHSVSFFRRMFIQPRAPFAKEKVGAFVRQFIPSLISDNLSADPVAQRERLSQMHSAAVAEALITGNWNLATGDFYPEYNDELHVVDDFIPESHLFKFRTFDWGSGEPFICLWWCVADSQTRIGNRIIPPGALICYREWYGAQPDNPAKGIHMRNEDIAKEIASKTKETMSGITLSDSYPFADRGHAKGGEKFTMADDFRDNGCMLTLGNTARIYGWKQLRSRLQGKGAAAGKVGIPLIYFARSCRACRDYIPALPPHETNEEDAAESGESTHACDAVRLACTAKPLTVEKKREREGNDGGSMTPAQILRHLSRKGKTFGSRR